MYTLEFIDWEDEVTVLTFDDSSDAVNAGVQMQVKEGGYNTSGYWSYVVKDAKGSVIYEDECMRHVC